MGVHILALDSFKGYGFVKATGAHIGYLTKVLINSRDHLFQFLVLHTIPRGVSGNGSGRASASPVRIQFVCCMSHFYSHGHPDCIWDVFRLFDSLKVSGDLVRICGIRAVSFGHFCRL